MTASSTKNFASPSTGSAVAGWLHRQPGRSNLTIRHVELKAWMSRFYPEERPPFLFSRLQRDATPVLSLEAVQGLFLEREGLRLRIEQREQEVERLRTQLRAANARVTVSPEKDSALSARSQTTYLNITGALLDLLLGLSPSGQPYSSFRTQEAIILHSSPFIPAGSASPNAPWKRNLPRPSGRSGNNPSGCDRNCGQRHRSCGVHREQSRSNATRIPCQELKRSADDG